MALDFVRPVSSKLISDKVGGKTEAQPTLIDGESTFEDPTILDENASPSPSNDQGSVESNGSEPKYAYATFLNRPFQKLESDDDDRYFVMARMMAYQLLHDPVTRTRKNFPFLVLTSEGVEESKIERLRKDGATVIPVKRITSEWLKTKNSQWWDQLTKLRLFELTQFEKIAYFDTDTIVRKNVDDIFDDPAAAITKTLPNPDQAPEDEGLQPSEYLFAGNGGAGNFQHVYPPPTTRRSLNAGCFIIMPSQEMLDYYMRIIQHEGRFPGKYMEQGLLSYAHRWEGNLPWKPLHWKWNTNWAVFNDTLVDIATLHVKYWEAAFDPDLTNLMMDMKGRMYGYWIGKELRG